MSSSDVKQLEDKEHVRLRIGMYLGSSAEDGETNPESLRTAIREAVDNSKDELIKGSGDTIWVFTDKKGTEPTGKDNYEGKPIKDYKKWYRYTVADNAGGIPIKATKNIKGETVSMMELALGSLRAGSKFSKTDALVGLNGIGVSAVNFTAAELSCYSHLKCHKLSETTDSIKKIFKEKSITESNKEGWYLKITWQLGDKIREEVVNIKDDEILSKYFAKDFPSTVTTFVPDPTIHGTTIADVPTDFKYLGYLYPKMKFFIDGKKVNTKIGYKYADSIQIDCEKKIVNGQSGEEDVLNPWIKFDYSIEVAKEFNDYKQEFSVNTLDCQQGKHVKMFETAWSQAFCDYFDNQSISGKYSVMGINALFILRCPEPSFSSQTKERLATIQGFESSAPLPKLVKSFQKIIKANEADFKVAYERIVEFHDKKQSIGKLKELKKQLGEMTSGSNRSASAYLPKKLVDCPCKDRMRAEVYFVEGDSAGGSFVTAKTGRDNIAVMPLRGKIKNVVGMDINKALENNEISDITYLCGGVNELHLELDKLHYGKFIIATDSDSDGFQIASLLLGDLMQNHLYLFGTAENKYEDSVVYIAVAPLFAFGSVDGTKANKYFYAGEEKLVADFQKKHKFKTAKRFKGLGELSPSEMKSAYLDETTRKLVKIKPDNIEDALALIENSHDELKQLMLDEKIISAETIKLKIEK